jgi:hypothetical protein
MKYVVQLSYTNPAHEHVSLRRRVDTVNRIIEAANENQAILRASQQQRALGFMIKEAKIVKEKEKMKKKEVVVDSNEKTEVAAAGGMKEEVEQVDEAGYQVIGTTKDKETFRSKVHPKKAEALSTHYKMAKSRKYKDIKLVKVQEEVEQVDEARRMSAAEKLGRAFDREKTASDASRKRGEEMLAQARAEYAKKQAAKTNEEAEQVDEANMRFDPEAAARPKSSDVKNFLNRNKNARAGAASKKYIRRMTKLGGLGPNQTKKDTEKHMKNYFEEVQISEASKEGKSVMYGMRASMKAMDLRHGVDSDKRDSGYKMSPAVRAAQAKSDALSKVEKPVQAGTLAALKRREMKKEEVEYIEEKLSAGDPASKWISDFVASDNPKFAGKTKKERINMALGAYYAAKKGKNEEVEHVEEAADPGKLRVVNKKVEAQASKDTKKSEQKSKATEKAIDVAKSKKNPVNLKPVLNGDKVNNA